MNKKTLILVTALVVSVGIILWFAFSSQNQKKDSQAPPSPTPLLTGPLSIIGTVPVNNAKDVSLNTPLNITFNKPFDPKSISVSIEPKVSLGYDRFENVLLISLLSPLQKNTKYSVFVNGPELKPYEFSFTTKDEASKDTRPNPTYIQQYEEDLKNNRPDLFLSNKTPFSGKTFSVSYTLTQKDPFYFVVSLKGGNITQSKQDTLNWFYSLGLTDSLLEKISLSYQAESVVLMKEKLPYYGTYMTISYNREQDKTTLIIYKENQTQGEEEFKIFLKSNNVPDASFINNLTILYD